jgi:hypothetical protein
MTFSLSGSSILHVWKFLSLLPNFPADENNEGLVPIDHNYLIWPLMDSVIILNTNKTASNFITKRHKSGGKVVTRPRPGAPWGPGPRCRVAVTCDYPHRCPGTPRHPDAVEFSRNMRRSGGRHRSRDFPVGTRFPQIRRNREAPRGPTTVPMLTPPTASRLPPDPCALQPELLCPAAMSAACPPRPELD